jgi:hypothetical protein
MSSEIRRDLSSPSSSSEISSMTDRDETPTPVERDALERKVDEVANDVFDFLPIPLSFPSSTVAKGILKPLPNGSSAPKITPMTFSSTPSIKRKSEDGGEHKKRQCTVDLSKELNSSSFAL